MAKPGIGDILKQKFRLEKHFPNGRKAFTFLATDLTLGREVVLKGHRLGEDEQLDRGLEEAKTLCQFDSPNIISVLEHFVEDGISYHVTPFCQKGNLADRIRLNGGRPLLESEVLKIMGQLLDGVQEVHRKDWVHTDIKPDNIVFKDNGTAALIDFETAIKKGEMPIAYYTPGYAPLEHDNALPLDHLADIYSLGAVAHYCLTLDKPVRARYREVKDEMAVLGQCEGASNFLKSIDKALSLDKRNRPQSVSAWRAGWAGSNLCSTSVSYDHQTGDHDVTRRNDTVGQLKQQKDTAKKATCVAIVLAASAGGYQLNQPTTPLDNGQLVEQIVSEAVNAGKPEQSEQTYGVLLDNKPTQEQQNESASAIAKGYLKKAKEKAAIEQWQEAIDIAKKGIDIGAIGTTKQQLVGQIRKARQKMAQIQQKQDASKARDEYVQSTAEGIVKFLRKNKSSDSK